MHGFTDVDRQEAPESWVQVLDTLSAEPFYAAYQQRVRELLHPRPGGRFLEVGAGAGTSAIRLSDEHGCHIVTADSSITMARTQRARGLRSVVTADAQALPFAHGSFDGASADRTIQHVADPDRCIDELVRTARSGGRIVLADPDYSTQTLAIEDQRLADGVLAFRAHGALRNGTLAHRHAVMLAARGVVDISVDAFTVVVRDAAAYDHVWGLRSWAEPAAAAGFLQDRDIAEFQRQFDRAVSDGGFTYSLTFFLTAGTVRR